jgi:predicted TIM-barrel fold metal-dependent hydrolase
LEIIDAQIHVGPGGIAETVSAMDAIGISAVMIDEAWFRSPKPSAPSYEVAPGVYRQIAPTAELAAWTHPGRFSYLLRVDHRDPEINSVARFARDADHCRALRVSPGGTGNRDLIEAFAAGDYDPVFAAAADHDLPIFVMIAGQTELMNRYLDKFPGLRVIICHTGMPVGRLMRPVLVKRDTRPDAKAYWDKVGEEPLDAAFDRVLRLADRPNVAMKWAHAQTMFDCPGFPNAGTWPYLRKAIDRFGADRIMFGTDYSVNVSGETWGELVFASRINPDLNDEERDWFFSKTARKWLDWPAE